MDRNERRHKMSMSKQDFIALADMIRNHNGQANAHGIEKPFTPDQTQALAQFCSHQNPEFKRDRWLGYLTGENGKNGGKVVAA